MAILASGGAYRICGLISCVSSVSQRCAGVSGALPAGTHPSLSALKAQDVFQAEPYDISSSRLEVSKRKPPLMRCIFADSLLFAASLFRSRPVTWAAPAHSWRVSPSLINNQTAISGSSFIH